jgi:anti-sigma B factor antagonist
MKIRERQLGNVVCLDVEGRMVASAEDGVLKDKVNSLLLEGQRHILLNFGGVAQIDSSGLTAITAARAAAEKHGGAIKLLNLAPRIYDLLVITRLSTLFEVFESDAEALGSFGQRAVV